MDSSPIVSKSDFIQNQAQYGGAVYVGDQELMIEASTFIRNNALSEGGAILSFAQSNLLNKLIDLYNKPDSSDLTLMRNDFTSNNATQGSVFFMLGNNQLVSEGNTFSDNSQQFGDDMSTVPKRIKLVVYEADEGFLATSAKTPQYIISDHNTVRWI